MSLIKQINDSLREKDPVELALETCGASHENEEESPCQKYMDPSRMGDFVSAIVELMKKGSSYGDAKAQAFDETEVPPPGSPCCRAIRQQVDAKLKK